MKKLLTSLVVSDHWWSSSDLRIVAVAVHGHHERGQVAAEHPGGLGDEDFRLRRSLLRALGADDARGESVDELWKERNTNKYRLVISPNNVSLL